MRLLVAPSCVDCDRINLPAKRGDDERAWLGASLLRPGAAQVAVWDGGTARQRSSGLLSIPEPLLWPLLVVVRVGFFVGVGVELSDLGQIKQSVRAR